MNKKCFFKQTVFFLSFIFVLLLIYSCKDNKAIEKDNISSSNIKTDVEKFLYVSDGKEITITGFSGLDTNIAIPSEIGGIPVTKISENAFFGVSYLFSVYIPDTVVSIDGAFDSCSDLTSVYIGSNVESMNRAFKNCSSLLNVYGAENVKYIDEAFSGCTSLQRCVILGSVTSASYAFAGCSSLTDVVIENGISALDHTFEHCSALSHILIPESVVSLNSTFYDCINLYSVEGGSNVSVYNNSFVNCKNLISLTLGSDVTELCGAFCGCSSLVSITGLPINVNNYSSSFTDCSSIINITVPNFKDNEALKVYSPSSDFKGCSSAKNVTVLADYTVTEEFCKAFSGLSSLENIRLTENVANALLRVDFTFIDTVYSGDSTDVAKALRACKAGSSVRIIENYSVIDGISYSYVYGGEIESKELSELLDTPVSQISKLSVSPSYWCGLAPLGYYKKNTVAIERSYSVFLRTTGKNLSLPENVTVNGIYCSVGE